MKVCERCGEEISTRDGDNLCPSCDTDAGERNRKRLAVARRDRKERDSVMRAVGLVKVRGALGGTYRE